MIQLLGIRTRVDKTTGKEQKYDAFFTKNWRAPSVKELFQDLEKYLSQVPEPERWNLYYTALQCGEGKRVWKEQWAIPFDVDNITVSDTPQGPKFDHAYLRIVCETLGIQQEETGIVFSGNGLQFIVGLKEPITDANFFEEKREHYKALCNKLNYALAQKGLAGALDPSVFSPSRLLRLPGTTNRKPGRPERKAFLINSEITSTHFNVAERSGLPNLSTDDALSPGAAKLYPKIDAETVQSECLFLKHCKENPSQISEPEWYAALSILGRMEQGTQLAHDYSKGHKGYSHAETEEKLAQSLKVSGPRTCKNIGSLWSGCSACKHFDKLNSPIAIRGPNYIKTQDTGFHRVNFDEEGNIKGKPVPNYEDLKKFFERTHYYRTMGETQICYTWKKTHFKEMGNAYLENFAQTHFKPYATTELVGEFRRLIQRTNLHEPEWFEGTTRRKVNFQNGVLDIDSMDFKPHSPEVGFRYVLNYNYEPLAPCPVFDHFLDQIMRSDSALKTLLLEYMGYALSNDDIWEHRALVMTGYGSNGKSTLISIIKALAGDGNYTTLYVGDLSKEGNRQMLDGKLFNIAEETPDKALMDSSHFKNLVAGGETQVRQIYKKPYNMKNRAKLIFACNNLPESLDTSQGFFRRFLIIPFEAEFSREKGNLDPFLAKKLLAELPGIFNRVLKAYQDVMKRQAFSESTKAQDALDQYRRDTDPALHWVENNLHANGLDPNGDFAVIQELYVAYAEDMKRMGLDAVNAIHFGRKLSRLIPDYPSRIKQREIKEKNQRVLLGVTRRRAEDC